MPTKTTVQMVGEAKMILSTETSIPNRFKNLLSRELIVDANINILTVEGQTISIPIMEILQLNWTSYCPETGELLEVE
jgi:hypothetical protein